MPLALTVVLGVSVLGFATPASADTVDPTVIPMADAPYNSAMSPDGAFLYVVDYGTHAIEKIDTSSNTVVAVLTLPEMFSVAVSADGARVYIVTGGGNSLLQLDTDLGVVGSAGTSPVTFDVLASPDGAALYVTGNTLGEVQILDPSNLTITATIPGLTDARWMAISPDSSTLYVTGSSADAVYAVDTTTQAVTVIPTGPSPANLAVTPDGSEVWVADSGGTTVTVIDTETHGTTGVNLGAGAGPHSVAITPDGTRAYVSRFGDDAVQVVDVATHALGATIPMAGAGPSVIRMTPDGRRAYVSVTDSDQVEVIDLDTPPVVTTTALPAGSTSAPYAASVVTTGSPLPTLSLTGTLPPGLTFDPATGAFIGTPTTPGSYAVSVIASSTVSGLPFSATRAYSIVIPAVLPPTGRDVALPGLTAVGLLLLGVALLRGQRMSAGRGTIG